MLNFEKPIPEIKVPSIKTFEIEYIQDEMVSLTKYGLICDSQYYLQGIPGAYRDCYARKQVAELLVKAESLLPDGLHLKIYDAYRPICIQERLWRFYRRQVEMQNPGLDQETLDFKTSFFVSKPSNDIMQPSLHNTGGAVDVTLVDQNYIELNMGTAFDDFTDKAWTNHFEKYDMSNPEVQKNRRILYNTMLEAGFTNLPSEWWHYDYGTKFWGYFKNQKALYAGILDIEFPDRYPLF